MRSPAIIASLVFGGLAAAVYLSQSDDAVDGSADATDTPIDALDARRTWPLNSRNEYLERDERLALIVGALRLLHPPMMHGRPLPTRPGEITMEIVRFWLEVLRRADAENRLGSLRPTALAMMARLQAATVGTDAGFDWDDFRTLYRLIPEAIRHRVDDEADEVLGRSSLT